MARHTRRLQFTFATFFDLTTRWSPCSNTIRSASGGNVVGLLIGYSSNPGTFTTEHLEKLMGYAPVAAIIIENAAVEEKAEMKANVTTDDLCHFFRLITMGEFSACFAHEVRNP